MKSSLTLLSLVFLCFYTIKANAQCTSCSTTINNQNITSAYTFSAASTICVTGTNTITGDLTFGSGTTVCIASGAVLTLSGNIFNFGANVVTINVYGSLVVTTSPIWSGNLNINIYSGGKMTTQTLTFSGTTVNLTNNGTFNPSTLQFSNSGLTGIITNNNSMTVTNTFNISSGYVYFSNSGNLTVGQNYNSSPTSVYVNCGTYTGSFNLNSGGKVINTGTFNTSQIDFGSSTSRIENYGYFNFNGSTINPSGGVIYNQGLFKFNSGNISGDCSLIGPSNSTYRGYFVWSKQAVMNNGSIGPNLNFRNSSGNSSQSAMFNNPGSLTWGAGITWGAADPASLPTNDCPTYNGSPSVPVPLSTSVCSGINLTSLQPSYANLTYEWWNGTSTSRTSQITSSLSNYTTVSTVYLWSKNVYSGTYSASGTAVSVVADPVASITPSSLSTCVNGAATLTVSVSGGVGVVSSIQWMSGTTSGGTFTNLPGEVGITYSAVTSSVGTLYYKSYIVQSGNACEAISASASVVVRAIPVASYLLTHVSCYGGSDGEIKVAGASGSGNYYFSIDNGSNYTTILEQEHTFTGLSAKNYVIKVKDSNGCISVP